MSSVSQYFKGLFDGIGALLLGMSVTWKELFAKKVTQQYPENRKTLVMSERFRGELVMPHDQNNEHACTACSICEMNCPNGTIKVTPKMIETEDGKKKKILDTYFYNLGTCTFCNLCVLTCPSNAIKFDNVFENAMFKRSKLNMRLNHEGSKLREKKKPAPAPAAPKPAADKPVEAKPAAATPTATEKPVAAKPVADAPAVEKNVVEKPAPAAATKPVAAEKPQPKAPIGDKAEGKGGPDGDGAISDNGNPKKYI